MFDNEWDIRFALSYGHRNTGTQFFTNRPILSD